MDKLPAVVFDHGDSTSKAGIAGDDAPISIISTVVGTSKQEHHSDGSTDKTTYVGDWAQSARGVLNMRYPMERGVVTDWDAMEHLLSFQFTNEVRRDPSAQPVLLTEAPLNPTYNREKMAEIMFEKFDVPAMYVAYKAVLSSHACGRGTGTVLHVGDGEAHVIPLYQGFVLHHSIERVDLAGCDITEHLRKLLRLRGYRFKCASELETIRDIKERLGYVALDYKKERQRASESAAIESSYELPDGRTVTIGEERFLCTEALFQPDLIGSNELGIHRMVHNAICKSDMDLRRDLRNVVIAGGTTMFPGFSERLNQELTQLSPPSLLVKVVAPPERKYTSWIGGSALASLSTFQEIWATKEKYDENGPRNLLISY